MYHCLIYILCLAAALVPFLDEKQTGGKIALKCDIIFPEFIEKDGLTECQLSPKEAQFFSRFPGKVAKFRDGHRMIIVRVVNTPTRLLHPALECFSGMGYSITANSIFKDENDRLWGSFKAFHRSGKTYSVKEIILDSNGKSWSDVSAWYWNAEFSISKGPWISLVIAAKTSTSI